MNEDVEQRWTHYTASLLIQPIGFLMAVPASARLQGVLPLNPQRFCNNISPDLAFNTAISFLSNTNWQSYAGETTMSYLLQMVGLAVQNFAIGGRRHRDRHRADPGLSHASRQDIGNFWVDLTRCTVYILLPCSIVVALFLCSQGVIQNLRPYADIQTVEGAKQSIAQGPVASQEAIKQFGTNGGGFFNANSAHPYENPTPLTNFVQMLLIFVIPGRPDLHLRPDGRRHSPGLGAIRRDVASCSSPAYSASRRSKQATRCWSSLGVQTGATDHQPGGNMEGKEVPLRHNRLGALCHHHNRCELWRRQQHARQLHTSWRTCPDVQHADQ